MNLQHIHIAVDFTELINHYPDISLVRNFPNQVDEHMAAFLNDSAQKNKQKISPRHIIAR